jgi:hypothetical protein
VRDLTVGSLKIIVAMFALLKAALNMASEFTDDAK